MYLAREGMIWKRPLRAFLRHDVLLEVAFDLDNCQGKSVVQIALPGLITHGIDYGLQLVLLHVHVLPFKVCHDPIDDGVPFGSSICGGALARETRTRPSRRRR